MIHASVYNYFFWLISFTLYKRTLKNIHFTTTGVGTKAANTIPVKHKKNTVNFKILWKVTLILTAWEIFPLITSFVSWIPHHRWLNLTSQNRCLKIYNIKYRENDCSFKKITENTYVVKLTIWYVYTIAVKFMLSV